MIHETEDDRGGEEEEKKKKSVKWVTQNYKIPKELEIQYREREERPGGENKKRKKKNRQRTNETPPKNLRSTKSKRKET